jgi:GNAT superfamily N-acetyltransferase
MMTSFITASDWLPQIRSAAQDISEVAEMIDFGWVTVAEIEHPAGFMACDSGQVHSLFVCAEKQGQGIGRALLRHAMETSPHLDLWTYEANSAARRFYMANGFVETGRTDGLGNDEHLPDIQFRWQREEHA